MKKTWIITYSGRQFDLENPQPDMVDIEDIAMSLANLCRFTGQMRQHYSVARHSIYVAKWLEESFGLGHPVVIQGLLHDAAEAYIGDINRPLKRMIYDQIEPIERRIEMVIWEHFGISEPAPIVKKADEAIFGAEVRDLLGRNVQDWGYDIIPATQQVVAMNPQWDKADFLGAFHYYSEQAWTKKSSGN